MGVSSLAQSELLSRLQLPVNSRGMRRLETTIPLCGSICQGESICRVVIQHLECCCQGLPWSSTPLFPVPHSWGCMVRGSLGF